MRENFYPIKQPIAHAVYKIVDDAVGAGEDPFDVHCNVAETAMALLRLYAIRQVANDARSNGLEVKVPELLDASDRLAALVSSNSVVKAISTMKSDIDAADPVY
ncbi:MULTISPECIES: hypothetical protein [unclassified Ruegeria]|uniref:hypothetical protein n=1 Tax=unclassified Ruegeria TaxID=2625375 RepID=UPI0014908E37|nr:MULTISPECIES: hypothetical protein [unclassified Ruegeria]NOD78912.1 hypothetical protein [Ruegeria sp. HKCCD4332]